MFWNPMILLGSVFFITIVEARIREGCRPFPLPPGNGSIDVDWHPKVGDIETIEIHYKCDSGFCLQGSKTSTCNVEKQVWSSTIPKCVPEVCGTHLNNAKNGLQKYDIKILRKLLNPTVERTSKEEINQKKSSKTTVCACPPGTSRAMDFSS